jgi:hypothetical protein
MVAVVVFDSVTPFSTVIAGHGTLVPGRLKE